MIDLSENCYCVTAEIAWFEEENYSASGSLTSTVVPSLSDLTENGPPITLHSFPHARDAHPNQPFAGLESFQHLRSMPRPSSQISTRTLSASASMRIFATWLPEWR